MITRVFIVMVITIAYFHSENTYAQIWATDCNSNVKRYSFSDLFYNDSTRETPNVNDGFIRISVNDDPTAILDIEPGEYSLKGNDLIIDAPLICVTGNSYISAYDKIDYRNKIDEKKVTSGKNGVQIFLRNSKIGGSGCLYVNNRGTPGSSIASESERIFGGDGGKGGIIGTSYGIIGNNWSIWIRDHLVLDARGGNGGLNVRRFSPIVDNAKEDINNSTDYEFNCGSYSSVPAYDKKTPSSLCRDDAPWNRPSYYCGWAGKNGYIY